MEQKIDKKNGQLFTLLWLIGWTVVYVVVLPFSLWFAAMHAMMFDSPFLTPFEGYLRLFIAFWTPLSIPATVCIAWSNYWRKNYDKARFLCAIPIVFFFFSAFVNGL